MEATGSFHAMSTVLFFILLLWRTAPDGKMHSTEIQSTETVSLLLQSHLPQADNLQLQNSSPAAELVSVNL